MTAAVEWGWSAWAWLVVPLAIYGLSCLTLFAFGRTEETTPFRFFFGQIGDTLRRITGYPGWSMAGALSGLMMLLVAVIGFYWDVAWHVDNGRDDQLFTPSHVMILVGLGGLVYAAVVAVLFASLEKAEVGLHVGPLRIPWSAVLLASLGLGGVTAFPLDAMWHDAYGVDVTLWSPPHIQLVAGGSLATIAIWLMVSEGRRTTTDEPLPLGRFIHVLAAGTVLVGMSTLQAEFDFGVPQFQALYLPIIIMIAAGFTLLATRVALGPWGAVKVTFIYLGLRTFLAVAIGPGLDHTVPRFPLYLGSALLVEAVAWRLGTERPLRLALSAGAAVGTLGLVSELAWIALWGVTTELPLAFVLKMAVLGPAAAVAAALVGTALGGTIASAPRRIPLGALAAAGIVLLAALAYPFPRAVGPVTATVRLQQVGSLATVEVVLDPPTAATQATAFVVTAWQGGEPTVRASLDQVDRGRYVSSRPMPVTGSWKTLVSLQRGDEVMAVPVYLPADPEIGAPAVPALPERTERFVRNTNLLLREVRPGPAGAAVAAYSGLAVLVSIWIALIAVAARRVPPPPSPPSDGWSVAGPSPAVRVAH